MRIPITTSETLFDLYRALALPVPLSIINNTGYTLVDGYQPFFAISNFLLSVKDKPFSLT